MKNIIKTIILLILIFDCYSITAQIKNKQLVGNWVFDYEKSFSNMDSNAKKALTRITGMQSKLESSYRNRKITFYDNGNYILHIPNGKKVEGNWNMNNEKANNVIIKTKKQQQQNLNIINNTPTELVLMPENSGNAKPFFSIWYFKKI